MAKRAIRKIGWSLTSLVVPEITMTIAAHERCTAKLLSAEMRKIIADQKTKDSGVQTADSLLSTNDDEQEDSGISKTGVQQMANNDYQKDNGIHKTNVIIKADEAPTDKHWSEPILSYYAVMGGFRVIFEHDPDHHHEEGPAPAQEGIQEIPRTEPKQSHTVREGKVASQGCPNNTEGRGCRCQIEFLSRIFSGNKTKCGWDIPDATTNQSAATLTPHGVLWMAKQGWLPGVAPEFVKDKSQVNTLAKVLVCFQAGVMILQVIARAAARQSVTLLELHTVLRAMCAGTMYISVCYFLKA